MADNRGSRAALRMVVLRFPSKARLWSCLGQAEATSPESLYNSDVGALRVGGKETVSTSGPGPRLLPATTGLATRDGYGVCGDAQELLF